MSQASEPLTRKTGPVSPTRVHGNLLRDGIVELFTARGVSRRDAGFISALLVETSLRGVDTHGVRLAPIYARLLDQGKATARPRLHFTTQARAIAHLDADKALGPVAGTEATLRAITLAKANGIGAVGVRASNHFGSAGHYANMMAETGNIGLVFSNADALVAPSAGVKPFFGTNPLAISAPALQGTTYSLDMATSQTSYSRILEHRRSGAPIPHDWALDQAGQPTLDSSAVGALSPLGGYKGQGLAMAVEILCTLLTGADFDHILSHAFDGAPTTSQSMGHFFVCINIESFCPLQVFQSRLSALLACLNAQEHRYPDEPVRFAGQRAIACRLERSEIGVPVDNEVLAELGMQAFVEPSGD